MRKQLSLSLLALSAAASLSAAVSINSADFAYYDNFNNFAGTGAAPNWTVIGAGDSRGPGYLGRSDGTSELGGIYSYGSNGDFSFGMLPNEGYSASIRIGFTNNLSFTIDSYYVGFDAEHWHGNNGGKASNWKFNYIDPDGSTPNRNYSNLDYTASTDVPGGAAGDMPFDTTALGLNISDRPIAAGETIYFEFYFPEQTDGYEAQGISFDNFTFAIGSLDGVTIDYMSNIAIAQLAAVPEPRTYAILAGLATLGFVAYRRKRNG
ncbi:MAG: PEP-CTERM sorting domain-containing protein [Verrucomicrobiota bacterium JB022]|nr:PEP-CTERM sorting domain-containing protein [Verrucomicrobiota bacterium JB022]